MKSSVLKDGVNAAPQRTLLHALGLTDEEIKKPLIGIVSSKNDIVPGHTNIDKVVEAVKMGVALAGGVPIGAVLAKDKFCAFEPGDHGTTFGGNPLACSAALCVVDQLLNKGLIEKSKEVSEYLVNEITKLKSDYEIIDNVRGAGLMLGIVFKKDISKELFKKMFEHKVLISAVSTNVMRLVPPLIITKADVDVFILRLKEVLDEYK